MRVGEGGGELSGFGAFEFCCSSAGERGVARRRGGGREEARGAVDG